MIKIRNMIKRAFVSLTNSDENDFPSSQVSYMGKSLNSQTIFPYGLSSNPPLGSPCIVFNVLGEESNQISIPYGAGELRFKSLPAGEVKVGNPTSNSSVLFKNDGTIVISGSANIEINSSGNVNINASEKINLGSGGAGIARIGDSVDLDTGIIITGSSNNFSD